MNKAIRIFYVFESPKTLKFKILLVNIFSPMSNNSKAFKLGRDANG